MRWRIVDADNASTSQQSQSHARNRATLPCPCLYVPNWPGNSVTVYAAGATGNAKPIQYIHGSRTALSDPSDIAVDAAGNMYVANIGGNPSLSSVTIYAAGATGNVAPRQIIAGSNTRLFSPSGIALDPVNGDIYVANGFYGTSAGIVTIYGPGSTGNVAPIAAIAGASTKLVAPAGLVLDASGNIYVPNWGVDTVTIYAAGSVGNVAPSRTIVGSKTKLQSPYQVALDSSSNIHVVNPQLSGNEGLPNSVTVFAAGANGNVRPIQIVTGRKAELYYPDGIALDDNGNTYVANGSDAVTVYAAGANGNVKPIDTIKGKKTELDGPGGIAIR